MWPITIAIGISCKFGLLSQDEIGNIVSQYCEFTRFSVNLFTPILVQPVKNTRFQIVFYLFNNILTREFFAGIPNMVVTRLTGNLVISEDCATIFPLSSWATWPQLKVLHCYVNCRITEALLQNLSLSSGSSSIPRTVSCLSPHFSLSLISNKFYRLFRAGLRDLCLAYITPLQRPLQIPSCNHNMQVHHLNQPPSSFQRYPLRTSPLKHLHGL